jgi:hypothetical protein
MFGNLRSEGSKQFIPVRRGGTPGIAGGKAIKKNYSSKGRYFEVSPLQGSSIIIYSLPYTAYGVMNSLAPSELGKNDHLIFQVIIGLAKF